MHKLRRLKYKIYRQLRSDITGEILLKYKMDKITVLILRQFEYKLNLFKREFKKWLYLVSPRSRKMGFERKRILYKNRTINQIIIKQKHNTGIMALFRNAHAIRKKLMRIWTIKQKIKKIVRNHFRKDDFNQLSKKAPLLGQKLKILPKKKKNEDEFDLPEMDVEEDFEKSENANLVIKSDSDNLQERNKKNILLFRKYPRAGNNFRGLILNKNKYKQIRINWLNIQLMEKRLSHFYGFKSIPRFKLLQDSAFYSNKLRLNAVFKLEGMISVIAFRLNLAPTVYQCRNIIRSGLLVVNGRRILNPTSRVKLFDDISINGPDEFDFMIDVMYRRLRDRKFFLNVPDYIEINYTIFHASFWRYPHKKEIMGPYNFPFYKSPYDWSSSTKTIRR